MYQRFIEKRKDKNYLIVVPQPGVKYSLTHSVQSKQINKFQAAEKIEVELVAKIENKFSFNHPETGKTQTFVVDGVLNEQQTSIYINQTPNVKPTKRVQIANNYNPILMLIVILLALLAMQAKLASQ